MAFRQSVPSSRGSLDSCPSLAAPCGDAANLRWPPGPGASASGCARHPRRKRRGRGRWTRPRRAVPSQGGSISPPPLQPQVAKALGRASGTESRVDASWARGGSARLPLGELATTGAEPTRQDPRAARPPPVALETPGATPARQLTGCPLRAGVPACGPPCPSGLQEQGSRIVPTARWLRSRCLRRPHLPRRAGGSGGRRPAAFGPAWEP